MNSVTAHILVFDSGVGGLSIVEHIRQQLPASSLSYLADNKHFPYGLLEEQLLIARVCTLISAAVQRQPTDIVVIACNTASTLVLPALRRILDIPVVGVVPAIKPAAQQSHSKVIGLLATPGTIQRDYTDDLIGNFGNDCDIIRVGSSTLVTMVEQLLAGDSVEAQAFSDIMALFENHPHWQRMDTVVLACTHFPLVKEQLAKAAPQVEHWIDSGAAIARRVGSLLQGTSLNKNDCQENIALITDTNKLSSRLRAQLGHRGFSRIQPFEVAE